MKFYFDTNIYNFIDACDESNAIRRFLDNSKHTVQASAQNLSEIYAIPNKLARKSEIATLVTVASFFESKPQSLLHANEVRREVGRCYPKWLIKIPFKKKVKGFIKSHTQRWKDAKNNILPPAHAYATYRRDVEEGIKTSREYQNAIRQRNLHEKRLKLKLIKSGKDDLSTIASDSDLRDPELFWRLESIMVWHNALVIRTPASRDYADWLDPYIKKNAFNDPNYSKFWLQDVKAEKVPRNRLLGLVAYYQTHHKISHGNPLDELHACNLLDSDLFFTADKAYYKVLINVANKHYENIATPILLDRQATSALGELSSVLGKMHL